MFEESSFVFQIIWAERQLLKQEYSISLEFTNIKLQKVSITTYKLRLPTFKIAKKFPNSLIEKSMQNSREKDVIAIVETWKVLKKDT